MRLWWFLLCPASGWTPSPPRSRAIRVVCGAKEDETALTRVGGTAADELLKALARADRSSQGQGRTDEDGVVVYEPSDFRTPWAVVHFVGGAAFGSFPDLAYGELLSRLCDRLGVGCVATPYSLSLDHEAAAQAVDALFRRALDEARTERAWPRACRVLGLGHSLGCKLLLLTMANRDDAYDQLGLVAPNNFGVADSARLMRNFLDAVRPPSSNDQQPSWTGLLDVVIAGATMAGIEVAPSPSDTLDILRRGAACPTRFLSFDNDDLDSTTDFVGAVGARGAPVRLPGGHLSPVYIKELSIGDIAALDAIVDALASVFSNEEPVLPLLAPPA
ncbi:hypothetical protein CTAYLR_004745 [Chrysophaeum taylorii]|uniref:DUF1350 domain-containing protein n=1 Tax=Chrysophaeum taylorii TaxID=2483200 RepID=A0AAD7XHM7_9STRA|nr:hypothetical protein CTAYLR_004745 [Chrysophaeum taylorii]